MGELETFVLGYLKQVGSLVESAAHGVHEVLLPEGVAERWDAPIYQQIAFEQANGSEVTYLSYNHPLVEEMVEEARAQIASTCHYINGLRLHKEALDELAGATWVLPNSRVVAQPRATNARVRSTYIRFNFKAAIVSDEKQERLVSVLMDAHTGCAAAAPREIEQRANAIQPDVTLQSLADAPMRWTAANGAPLSNPLAESSLKELLQRSKMAVLRELAEPLRTTQKRAQHFWELDQARLNDYYDEIERDLKQRMATASPDRRAALVDKVAVVTAERASKLADVAERYQMQLGLTLLNLMIIVHPKLLMPVGIENRTTKIQTYAVWDPLLHRLEPLICAVCGLSSERTFLCHHGHLAHEECLTPACIDCKRVFCRQCSDALGHCDVCLEPLCRYSRIVCNTCGRGTCQAHKGLCHANEGQPVVLAVQPPSPRQPEPEPAPPKRSRPETSTKKPLSRPKPKPTLPQKTKTAPARSQPPKGIPKPQRIEVVVGPQEVVAYLLASRERQIAMRTWKLDSAGGGIVRTCECEKGSSCPANRMVIRPFSTAHIEAQMLEEIASFRQEYGLPSKKVNFNQAIGSQFAPTGRFTLFGLWKNETALAQARAVFDRLYRK